MLTRGQIKQSSYSVLSTLASDKRKLERERTQMQKDIISLYDRLGELKKEIEAEKKKVPAVKSFCVAIIFLAGLYGKLALFLGTVLLGVVGSHVYEHWHSKKMGEKLLLEESLEDRFFTLIAEVREKNKLVDDLSRVMNHFSSITDKVLEIGNGDNQFENSFIPDHPLAQLEEDKTRKTLGFRMKNSN